MAKKYSSEILKIVKENKYAYDKLNEYIVKKNYDLSDNEYNDLIIICAKQGNTLFFCTNNFLEKVFKKRQPNEEQINQIVNIYSKKTSGKNFDIIEALIATKYVFSEENINKLITAGCGSLKPSKFDENYINALLKMSEINFLKSLKMLQKNAKDIELEFICLFIKSINVKYYMTVDASAALSSIIKNCNNIDATIYDYLLEYRKKFSNITTELLNKVAPRVDQIDAIGDCYKNILYIFICRRHEIELSNLQLCRFLTNKVIYIELTNKQYFLETDYNFILKKGKKSTYNAKNSKYCYNNIDNIHIPMSKRLFYGIDVFLLFDHFKLTPNIDCLKYFIEIDSIQLATEIIDKHKIVPNKECLDLAVGTNSFELVNKILCYKIIPDRETVRHVRQNVNNNNFVFNLYKHGLQLTAEDIEILLMNNICLSDLSIFNIECDEKLYFVFHKFDRIKGNKNFKNFAILANLRELFCHNKTSKNQIINEMQKNNLEIDQYCVDNAYNYNNKELIEFLKENYNCKPSLMCLIKKSTIYINNKCPQDYLEGLNITAETMAMPVSKKV